MIIRLSTGLAKRHGVRLHEAPPPEDNGYLDWTCRRFDANAGFYLMMTNTNSLYTMLEAADDAREIGLLITTLARCMERGLRRGGYARIWERHIKRGLGDCRYCKALNRSITGSMNDLVWHARFCIEDEMGPLDQVCERLNAMPFFVLEYRFPKEAFEMIELAHVDACH